jgi:hypothetical protein
VPFILASPALCNSCRAPQSLATAHNQYLMLHLLNMINPEKVIVMHTVTQCTRHTASTFRPISRQWDHSSTVPKDTRCIAPADYYCGMRNHRTGSEHHTHSCCTADDPHSDSALTHSHSTVLARCSPTFKMERRSCSLGWQCSILLKASPGCQNHRPLMRAQCVACRTFKSLIL